MDDPVPEDTDAPAGVEDLGSFRRADGGVHPMPGLTGDQEIELPAPRIPLLETGCFDAQAMRSSDRGHPGVRLDPKQFATVASEQARSDAGPATNIEDRRGSAGP